LAKNFIQDLEVLLSQRNEDYLTEESCKILIYQLDILLQNYFSLVPSDAYTSIGDISLYDHTKTTVAIAVVLHKAIGVSKANQFNYSIPTAELCKNQISLIAGDFPSIQQYLFGNIKKNTDLAKRLRAKSLTVQLMNEAVVEFLLEKLELPRASVLMNAGGKFVILSEQKDDDTVNTLAKKVNNFLIKQYEGNIKFIITKQDFKLSEVFEIDNTTENVIASETKQSIQEVFGKLFDKLSLQKYQIYDQDQLFTLFETKEPNGKVVCKYCGLYTTDEEDERNEESCCEKCKENITL
jgi:CRISPR-associated protein Csm1